MFLIAQVVVSQVYQRCINPEHSNLSATLTFTYSQVTVSSFAVILVADSLIAKGEL